jgi:oxygen-dependent protoporphyrinogen oxidase
MKRRVVVVGGGIAGLAAAHRLTELQNENALDLEIALLEGSTRLGGAIATEQVGDFVVEAGPDSFITEKPWALRLCERLGLASRLVATQSATKRSTSSIGTNSSLPEGFFIGAQ